MPRLPDPDPETLTPEQKAIFEDIAASPRGGVRGPFKVLIYSPGLCDRVQKLGAFVRYDCSVPQKLRELAILITARHMSADYEWHAHEPHALKAGLAAAIVEAIRAGERPAFTEPARAVKVTVAAAPVPGMVAVNSCCAPITLVASWGVRLIPAGNTQVLVTWLEVTVTPSST